MYDPYNSWKPGDESADKKQEVKERYTTADEAVQQSSEELAAEVAAGRPAQDEPPKEAAPVSQRPMQGAAVPVKQPAQGASPYQQPGYTGSYGQQPGYGSSYYGGPYYNSGAAQGQRADTVYTAPKASYTAPVAPTVPPETQAVQPARRKAGGFLKALGIFALVAACLLAGFGGGYYASRQESGTAVVYRTPESRDMTNIENTSYSGIANTAKENVVSISTEYVVSSPFGGEATTDGAGSGVIITADGYIVTNHHVIDGANTIMVQLPDGSEAEAVLIGSDERSDIAVVKVNVTELTPAVIGDSDEVNVGDLALAVGNPLGTLGGTVTDGIVSALDREVTIDGNTMTLMQMSAAVSPGNSGGGLFNANAELIGVVNAKASGDNSEGLGFAIPINTAIQVAEDLISKGYVSGRPAMGVSVVNVTSAELALQWGYNRLGVFLHEITPGGAADLAGLQARDEMITFDGQSIGSTTDLTNAINRCAVGDEVEVTVLRGDELITVTVVLQEMVPS